MAKYEYNGFGCSYQKWNDVLLYFCGITHNPYEKIIDEDKEILIETHTHLKSCDRCNEDLSDFVKLILCNEDFPEESKEFTKEFSAENFRLMRQNQEHIDSILSRREIVFNP